MILFADRHGFPSIITTQIKYNLYKSHSDLQGRTTLEVLKQWQAA